MTEVAELTPAKTVLNVRTSYESLADFGYKIPDYLMQTKEIKKSKINRWGVPQENSFYLNSSDSLETLMGLNFEGKKVLTVSGSGEFAHAFVNGGAEEVCCFDISPVAAFNSELRHAALCVLDMDDYMKLFGNWVNSRENDIVKLIWDKVIYKKVEPYLSPEAKNFFNMMFEEPELVNLDDETWGGFARVRFNKKTRYNRLVGDIITKEEDYIALQDKARRVKFTQVICDAHTLDLLVGNVQPDLIYIGNIGYYPDKTIKIGQKYIANGTPEVICTVSSNDKEFNDSHLQHPDSYKFLYYQDKKIEPGSKIAYELYDKDTQEFTEVPIEVVGTDKNADYGLVLKLYK